jgi:hypothetical protein
MQDEEKDPSCVSALPQNNWAGFERKPQKDAKWAVSQDLEDTAGECSMTSTREDGALRGQDDVRRWAVSYDKRRKVQ